MAERYGGRFSPGGAGGGEAWRRSRAGARVNLLFIVPAVLLFTAFGQAPAGLALDLAAFGVLELAAWLTREGLIAEDAYDARKVARRPAIPRKIFGSLLTGVGLALAGMSPETFGPVEPAIFFVFGAALHFLSFGADPMRDKGAPDVDAFQADRVARVVDEAETHLAAMGSAIRRAGLPALTRRVEDFAGTARRMIRTVEEDPRDLSAARRYLGVYLMGAKEATERFADVWTKTGDEAARRDYETLLDDLERSFGQRTEKMLLDDRSDLSVEIEVLRERLAREGVRHG